MRYVRPVDKAELLPTGHPGLQARLLSNQESAMIFDATVCDGGRAAGLHYHHRDQIYFQRYGTMTVQLGSDVHRIGANTLVYIPAGLPHCNWNEGPGDEGHLEVIAPATQIGAPLAHMVETPDRVPPDWAPRGSAAIVRAEDERLADSATGDRRHGLIGATTTGVVDVDYVEIAARTGWHDTRIYRVDKNYFVLSGRLDFEIALTSESTGPNTLVSLPAGVPHRISNNSPAAARLLDVTTAAGESDILTDQPIRVSLLHSM